MARPPLDIIHLKLRFSEALRRRLAKEAARTNRSMNAEIIHRLEQSFSAPDIARAVAEALPTRIIGLEQAIANMLERQEGLRQQREREEAKAVEAQRELLLVVRPVRQPEPV